MADGAAQIAAADNRAAVSRKIKQVGTADGTAATTLRKWLKDIDTVHAQLGQTLTLQVIDSTTSGRHRKWWRRTPRNEKTQQKHVTSVIGETAMGRHLYRDLGLTW